MNEIESELISDSETNNLVPIKTTKWLQAWNLVKGKASLIMTVLSIVLGILLGFTLFYFNGEKKLNTRVTSYVGYLGELILNMFECLVIPLMCSSIITATASLDQELAQRIGLMAVATILVLNATTAIVTVLVCYIIKPGELFFQNKGSVSNATAPATMFNSQRLPVDYLLDLVRNLVPPNYIQALIETVQTEVPASNVTDSGLKYKYIRATNTVGMTLMSVAIGMAISRIGVYGHCILAFCQSLIKFLTLIIDELQWIAPIMVISLIASAIAPSGLSAGDIFSDLGPVLASFLFSLTISSLMAVGAYWIYTRRFPLTFSQALLPAVLTAFGNTSTLITLPITLSCLDEIGVNPRSSRFLVPVASVWSWGSTAYMSSGIVFSAQYSARLNNKDLPKWGDAWTYSLAGFFGGSTVLPVPQAGADALEFFLSTLGVQTSAVRPFLSIDYIIDPFTTGMNVIGGAIVATLVNDLNRIQLSRLESYEKDLNMVATLVRLNQALETTLEEEEEEEHAGQVKTEAEEDKGKSEGGESGNNDEGHGKDKDTESQESKPNRRKKRGRTRLLGTTVVNRLLDRALEHGHVGRVRSGRGSPTRSHNNKGILRKSGSRSSKRRKGSGSSKKKNQLSKQARSEVTLMSSGKKHKLGKKKIQRSSKNSSHHSGNEEAAADRATETAPASPEETTMYHEESESLRGSLVSSVQLTEPAPHPPET